MDDVVLSNVAEKDGQRGTLVLSRERMRFIQVSPTGIREVRFDIGIQELTVEIKGLMSKKIEVTDTTSHQTHTVKVQNLQGWMRTINALKRGE